MFDSLLIRRRLPSWWMILIVILALFPLPCVLAGGVPIGVLLPLSGPLADFGSSAANALKFAVDEINNEGGIRSVGGLPIWPDIEDWGSNPKSILYVATRYASEKVPVLIGTGASSATVLTSQITEKFELPLIDGSSSLPEGVLKEFEHTFALTGTISQFVEVIGELIAGTEVLIAHENTDWGQRMRDSIMALNAEGKIRVVGEISVPYGREDVFNVIIDRLVKERKAVLFQATGEGIGDAMIRYFNGLGFKPRGWINMAASYDASRYIRLSGLLVEGMVTISPYSAALPIKGNQRFVDGFIKRFGESPDSVAGMYWNCAWLVKDVLERTGSFDRRRVTAAIRKTDLQSGKKSIYLSDGIRFDKSGRNILHRPPIIQIQNKRPVIVWPKKYQEREWIPFPAMR